MTFVLHRALSKQSLSFVRTEGARLLFPLSKQLNDKKSFNLPALLEMTARREIASNRFRILLVKIFKILLVFSIYFMR